MKKIFQIARIELSQLFYSPIAWLLTIILFFQMAFLIVVTFEFTESLQNLFHFKYTFLTFSLFAKPRGGMLSQILSSLYLYIPLLTMGVISRESSSGTIRLLYSSPLTMRQIILGKFAGLMVYSLVLIGALSIALIGAWMCIPHFDYPLMISGLLGIFLLLCAYSAIGIFMSSLTTYQVVAGISTFVVFTCLNYIGNIWQGIDFVRDLTYCISLPGRADKMVGGLITTRDVAYFVIMTCIFLSLTINKMRMEIAARGTWFRISRFTIIILIGVSAGYLTSRWRYIGYYDVTATKLNTIRKNTQDVLKKMGDERLEITQYVNVLDDTYSQGSPEARIADINRWEPYLRFKPSIDLKYVYYYDSIPNKAVYQAYKGKSLKQIFESRVEFLAANSANFITPEEIHNIINLRGENNRLVMELKYKGKKTFLRVFDDVEFWPSENEIGAALKRLIVKAPKIAFATDGYGRGIDKIGDRDYKFLTNLKTFRYAMINQGFDVDTFSLAKNGIPDSIAALVIADPRVDFDSSALNKVSRYIDKGGNLLLAGEPGKQQVNNPLFNPLGVKLMEGTILQHSKDFSYDMALPYLTNVGGTLNGMLAYNLKDSIPVSMPGLAGLVYEGNRTFKVQPLLILDSIKSWNKVGQFVLDSAALEYEPARGDQKGLFPAVLALTRMINGKEQRIIAAGDADFMSNKEMGRQNVATANFSFANAIFGWFAYGEFPIDATRPRGNDNVIGWSEKQVKIAKLVYLVVIPGLLLLAGTVLLVRRKRK